MRRFLLLGLSIAFLLGISAGLFLDWGEARILVFLCVGMIIAWSVSFQRKDVLFVSWLGCCVIVGMLIATHSVRTYQLLEGRTNVQGIGVVRGEMSFSSFHANFVTELLDCGQEMCPEEYVLVRTSRYRQFSDGMRIHFGPCDLRRPEQFDPNFNYSMYLAKEGVGFIATDCPFELIPDQSDWLRGKLHRVRIFVSSVIGERISEPEAGLARGLILGGSDELPESLAHDFRVVGLSHIVAVSGYNISVLAGGFFLIGIGLGWYRKRAIWIAFLGTVLFVFLVGAPASAVRAAIVAIAGFLAFSVSRPMPIFSLLCFAAVLMLFGNPLLLRYDIGFQLSFLATFAILFSAPWRNRFKNTSWLLRNFLEIFLTTFSVLLFVMPITLVYFGTLSPYALLANVIILPLVPIAFLLTLGVVIFGWIPGIGAFIGWITYGILHSLVVLTEIIARFPGADASYTGVHWWGVFAWYGFCLTFFLWQGRRASKGKE
jgi:competence protein ComEC